MILRRLAAGLIRHLCAARVTSGRDLVLYTTPAESTKIKLRTTRILFSTHKKISKKKEKKIYTYISLSLSLSIYIYILYVQILRSIGPNLLGFI